MSAYIVSSVHHVWWEQSWVIKVSRWCIPSNNNACSTLIKCSFRTNGEWQISSKNNNNWDSIWYEGEGWYLGFNPAWNRSSSSRPPGSDVPGSESVTPGQYFTLKLIDLLNQSCRSIDIRRSQRLHEAFYINAIAEHMAEYWSRGNCKDMAGYGLDVGKIWIWPRSKPMDRYLSSQTTL